MVTRSLSACIRRSPPHRPLPFEMHSKTLSRNQVNKKTMEKRVLVAAGQGSALIPIGEVQDFEKPDFRIETAVGLVGIEVTELCPRLPPISFRHHWRKK